MSKQRDTVDRVSVEYLATLYEHEPSVRDVWVEGNLDSAILHWFLTESGVEAVKVRDVDEIESPAEDLFSSRLSEGRRSRVLFAAKRLADVMGSHDVKQATFVADRDRYDLPAVEQELVHLLLTDFRDFEMYLCSERVLRKLHAFVLGQQTQTEQVSELLIQLRRIGRVISAYFDTRSRGWPDYKDLGVKEITYTERRGLVFDEGAYRNSFINSNGGIGVNGDFLAEVQARLSAPGDDRMHIRGHTFCEILGAYIAVRSKVLSRAVEGLVKVMVTLIELADLKEQSMFKQLLQRMAE